MTKNLGNLYIVSAPSGAGKTTLVSAIVKSMPSVHVSISHTTRPIRPGEQQGIDYHFLSHAEFKEMIHQNLFLEQAQVFGNYYGTSRLWVEETRAQGKDVILEIDWQGARQIRTQYLDTQSIYILPPSREALAERLNKRHQDTPSNIEQRMQEAKLEISHYQEYDYVICNDQFDDALKDLQTIIQSFYLRLKYQEVKQEKLIRKLIE